MELVKYVSEINEEHRKCRDSMQAGLEHALRVGELLSEVKGNLKHGEFIPWVENNCEFSTRTAQTYMRVFKELPKLGNTQRVALLSLRSAVEQLTEPKETFSYENLDKEFLVAMEKISIGIEAIEKGWDKDPGGARGMLKYFRGNINVLIERIDEIKE